MERPKKWNQKLAEEYTNYISKGKIKCIQYNKCKSSLFKCNECGTEFKNNMSNFINYINRNGRTSHDCNYAKKFSKMTKEKFFEKVKNEKDIEDDEYTFLEDFIDYNTKILCRHNKCGHEWKVRPSHFTGTMHTRCPNCNNKISKYEKLIKDWLDKNNIIYEYQYKIPENIRMSFDFMLKDENNKPIIAIEYNGEQHYKPKFNESIEEFNKQVERDKFKVNYCKENDIAFLVIPFKERNNYLEILNDMLENGVNV